MKKIIQKAVFISVSLAAFLLCTAGIISSFMFGDNLQKILNSVLKIKVYEPYIGGKVINTIFDPLHDDTGSGTAVYPANSAYAEGNLDLVLYTVHEPVYHAPWQSVPEYWQLVLEFRTGFKDIHNPDYNRSVYIYIDADNDGKGSLMTLFDQGENVRFHPDHPWDYAAAVGGNKGSLYNSKGEKVDELEVVYSTDGRKILIRIPLTKKERQKLYTVEETHHYVLVGAYSPLDYAQLLPIAKRRSRTAGGGNIDSLMPKVYDVLFDGDHSTMLSSWDDETFEFALLNPVTVAVNNGSDERRGVSQEKIQELQKEIDLLNEEYKAFSINRIHELTNEKNPSVSLKQELALLALNSGDRLTAETLFKELLLTEPDNPTFTAYTGSLESMKGAGAPVVAAVEAVNRGYVLLDKAVLLTEGTLQKVKDKTASEEDILHRLNALLNRGGNSQSVPNTVFLKAAQGSQDYLEAAEIAFLDNNLLLAAGCYYDASICYSLDNKESDAVIWKREAARIFMKIQEVDNLEDKINYVSLKLKLYEEGYIK